MTCWNSSDGRRVVVRGNTGRRWHVFQWLTRDHCRRTLTFPSGTTRLTPWTTTVLSGASAWTSSTDRQVVLPASRTDDVRRVDDSVIGDQRAARGNSTADSDTWRQIARRQLLFCVFSIIRMNNRRNFTCTQSNYIDRPLTLHHAVIGCLEILSRLETVSRQCFYCLSFMQDSLLWDHSWLGSLVRLSVISVADCYYFYDSRCRLLPADSSMIEFDNKWVRRRIVDGRYAHVRAWCSLSPTSWIHKSTIDMVRWVWYWA